LPSWMRFAWPVVQGLETDTLVSQWWLLEERERERIAEMRKSKADENRKINDLRWSGREEGFDKKTVKKVGKKMKMGEMDY
jgi:hypothetical protein